MYVGALHMHTTEKSLTDYFSQFGEVQHCQVKFRLNYVCLYSGGFLCIKNIFPPPGQIFPKKLVELGIINPVLSDPPS